MRKQSTKANIWLDYCQTFETHPIKREYRVGKYYADGFIIEINKAFEFFGSFFHVCRQCYQNNRNKPISLPNRKDTFETLYEKTIRKLEDMFAWVSILNIYGNMIPPQRS